MSTKLYRTGDEYFPALLRALENARAEILFEVYIFREDRTGHAVAARLMAAARRGVRVRLLLDGWGSNALAPAFVENLRAAGVEVRIYKPLGRFFRRFKKSLWRRLHTKVVCVDAKLAFVGGINVLDEQVSGEDRKGLFDYALSITGAVVATVRRRLIESWGEEPSFARAATPVADRIYVSRDNYRNRSNIEREYLKHIREAQHEILIASAYFFPSRRFRRALVKAARRGVRVSLLLQGLMDLKLIRYASKGLYPLWIREGIDVFEDHGAVVHAKVAVFDREWLTVGSSNLDPLSLGLIHEANLFVRDAKLATRLAAQLRAEIEVSCCRVGAGQLRRRSWPSRALFWVSLQLIRILSGLLLPRRRLAF